MASQKPSKPVVSRPADAEPMDKDEVLAAVGRLIDDAKTFIDGEVSPARAQATDYYMGELFGNEEEGRSQYVSHDVRDTVSSTLPQLMDVFWGPKRVVKFVPRRADAIPAAEQATDFIGEIVLKEDNDGFSETYAWKKDALVRKIGIVKWWWEDKPLVQADCAYNLTPDQAQLLLGDPGVEPTKITEKLAEDGQTQLMDVEFTRTVPEGRARFACLPPEEFHFNREARSLDEAEYVAHYTFKTKSELRAMGVSEEDIEEYAGGPDNENQQNAEEIARNPSDVKNESVVGDESTDKVLYVEAYPYLDVDGDHIAELRCLKCIGPGHHVINGDGLGEAVSQRPFALLCPNPEPHTLLGLSQADDTMDLQLVNSSLIRGQLDAFSLSLFPRIGYVEGEVNVQDLLSTEIGAPVRMDRPGMIQPIEQPYVGDKAFPLLEMFKAIKEERTGQSMGAMGLDADALQSSTPTAVNAAVSASQLRIKMIARIFANTGYKRLFKGLLKLVIENQPRERIVRLRGQFVPIDPRSWDADMDVSTEVALGSQLDQEIALLMTVAQKQEQILQTVGPNNPLVSLGQYVFTLREMLKLKGRFDIDNFFKNLPIDFQTPPPQPKPDPAEAKAQAEIMRAQADVQRKALDMQIAQLQHDLKVQETQARIALAEKELAANIALQQQELELKYGTAYLGDQMRNEIARDEAALKGAAHATKASGVPGASQRSHRITINRDDLGRVTGLDMTHQEDNPTEVPATGDVSNGE